MKYHLSRNGQNLGTFPLEELYRRLVARELAGTDLVWCPGMAGWESLDLVLRAKGLLAAATGIPSYQPAAKAPRKRVWPWVVAGVAVCLFIFAILGGLLVLYFSPAVQTSVDATADGAYVDPAEVAGKRILTRTNSITEKIVRQRSHEFRVRQYLEGYKTNGMRDEPCDAQALEFLNDWVTYDYYSRTQKNFVSLQMHADKLTSQAGCDDPLVMTVAALVGGELQEKTRRLEKAVAGFPKSHHKAYPQFCACVMLAAELERNSPRIAELDQQAIRSLKKSFTDGSLQSSDAEEIGEVLVNGWGRSFFHRNGAAVYQAAGESKDFAWLALVLEGQYHINEAWKARGSGWADSVSETGWKAFGEHLAKARSALTEAWNRHRGRPLPAACMIEVAMAKSGAEDMRQWFDRAVAAQIDHPQAWTAMRWGLRPRWHGSQDAMLALGVRAVDTQRFDTDVPRKLFDVVSDLETELELSPGEHIYGRADIWPHLQKMYEGYIAATSEKDGRDGWRSTYAVVAYIAGKYDVARAQLEAVDWKPWPRNLTGWGTELSLMPVKVAALTGKSGERVSRAETSASQLDLAGAIKIHTELSNSADADERTREFCRARLAALKEAHQLGRGEWIDFLPADRDDPNWAMGETKIRRLEDGAIEVGSTNAGYSFYSRTQVGPDFELTGQFEVVRSSNKAFQAGILIGLPDALNSTWYGFRLKRNATEGQGVSFSRGWTKNQIWKTTELKGDANAFRFRLLGGKADAWVNGVQVLKNAVLAKDLQLSSDSLVGLGAYHDTNELVVRYRNVRLRRVLPDR